MNVHSPRTVATLVITGAILLVAVSTTICSLFGSSAYAQSSGTPITTVTTLQDGDCGKVIYCTLATTDEDGMAGSISLDNRVTGGGPLGRLTVNAPEFAGVAVGTYSGFGGNPNGTKQAFDGQATYSGTGYDPSGVPFTITGTFPYHAIYNNVCQGRGCPTVGWHFTIKAGSTATVSE